MKICPTCGSEWIREEYTKSMVCRELRLLDINNDLVDYDESKEYLVGDVISYVCVSCNRLFHGETPEQVWDELKEIE